MTTFLAVFPRNPPDLLLVDDDPTFCTVLGKALGKCGFSVRIAHNANKALALADQKTPQYAVVDLQIGDKAAGRTDLGTAGLDQGFDLRLGVAGVGIDVDGRGAPVDSYAAR